MTRFRGGKTTSLLFKCLEKGRISCAGQPNTVWSRARCSGGCSHSQIAKSRSAHPEGVQQATLGRSLSHSDTLLTTVNRDLGIPSLSPRGESDHHNFWLLPSQHPVCLPREDTNAAELHTRRTGFGPSLQSPKYTDWGVGQIMLGFLTWNGAARLLFSYIGG